MQPASKTKTRIGPVSAWFSARFLSLSDWYSARFGLRGKLVLLVLLVLLPLLTLDIVQINGRFKDQVADELAADQDFAHAIAAAFSNFVQSRWDEELAMGGSILRDGGPTPPAQVQAVLKQWLAARPGTLAYSWVTADGQTITLGQPGWVPPPQEEMAFLTPLKLGQDEVISDLLESPDGSQFSVAVARAIYRGGRYMGAVVAYLDPMQFNHALPVDRSGASTFTLVDRQGAIVYSDSIFIQLGRPGASISPDSPAHTALHGQTALATTFHSTVNGTPRMGAAVPITSIHWAAVANTAESAVLAVPRRDTLRDSIVLVFAVAFSVAWAILLGRRLLRPLADLQRAARDISHGDLNARAGYGGTDELGQTAAVFDQMAGRVQALIAQREQFLQVAAHELRNPMTSVKGMLSLVRHRAASGRPMGDLVQLAGLMEDEIDRLSGLLNEILEAFRIHDGRLALQFEAVDMTVLVESVLQPFRVSAENHRFQVVAPAQPVRVWGDRHRLEEVLRNLYSNAVKYSLDGGDVMIELAAGEKQALLAVRDSGLGIPADQLSKVFEGFYRATNLQGQDPGGLGLGLFICQDIVERHRGRIWAESTEGAGATFFVALPLLKAEEAS